MNGLGEFKFWDSIFFFLETGPTILLIIHMNRTHVQRLKSWRRSLLQPTDILLDLKCNILIKHASNKVFLGL